MRYIIDRFEQDYAICEDEAKAFRSIPLSTLPPCLKEGDVVLETNGAFTLSPAETEERRRRMREKRKKLFH